MRATFGSVEDYLVNVADLLERFGIDLRGDADLSLLEDLHGGLSFEFVGDLPDGHDPAPGASHDSRGLRSGRGRPVRSSSVRIRAPRSRPRIPTVLSPALSRLVRTRIPGGYPRTLRAADRNGRMRALPGFADPGCVRRGHGAHRRLDRRPSRLRCAPLPRVVDRHVQVPRATHPRRATSDSCSSSSISAR